MKWGDWSIARAYVAKELHSWVKKRPKAIHALENTAAEKKIAHRNELVLKLESTGLIKQGKLTRLGDIVYERLHQ